MTEFSIYNRDDYKRCICTFYGLAQFDCEQEEPKCQWTDGILHQSKKEITVTSDEPIQIDAYGIVDSLVDFSECVD